MSWARHSQAIVRAVLGLGCSLDVPVLAEGVESKVAFDFLFQEGCSAVQGYYSGRPMPVEAHAAVLHPGLPDRAAI